MKTRYILKLLPIWLWLMMPCMGLGLNGYSQNGFRKIEKAKRMVAEGRYRKAKHLLRSASHADYGFCGNAWFDAELEIKRTEVRRLMAMERFGKAKELLDSYEPAYDYAKWDFLRLQYYSEIFGDTEVFQGFPEAMQALRIEGNNVVLPFTKSHFHIILNYSDGFWYNNGATPGYSSKMAEAWRTYFFANPELQFFCTTKG